MNFFGLLKRSDPLPATAPVARERLQVLLAHERGSPRNSSKMVALKEDIIDAIVRHMLVEPEAVKVKIDRRAEVSILRIAVDIPA
jgi:cell division topological specificity factor